MQRFRDRCGLRCGLGVLRGHHLRLILGSDSDTVGEEEFHLHDWNAARRAPTIFSQLLKGRAPSPPRARAPTPVGSSGECTYKVQARRASTPTPCIASTVSGQVDDARKSTTSAPTAAGEAASICASTRTHSTRRAAPPVGAPPLKPPASMTWRAKSAQPTDSGLGGAPSTSLPD